MRNLRSPARPCRCSSGRAPDAAAIVSARLMRTAGLQGRHRRRRHLTTIPDPRAALRPDLIVRDFQPDRAGLDARWCGDITYIPTEEGWLYLATVIDIASRRVVGRATADHLRTELVTDA